MLMKMKFGLTGFGSAAASGSARGKRRSIARTSRLRFTRWTPWIRSSCGERTSSLARFDGQHGKAGARVGDVVELVSIERAYEPAAGFTLVALEPSNAALDCLMDRRQTCLAQHVNDEAGA